MKKLKILSVIRLILFWMKDKIDFGSWIKDIYGCSIKIMKEDG